MGCFSTEDGYPKYLVYFKEIYRISIQLFCNADPQKSAVTMPNHMSVFPSSMDWVFLLCILASRKAQLKL